MFSPAPQDGWSPLHRASQGGHLEVVEALLAKGADVQAKKNVSIARAVHARIGVCLCACSVYIGERACVCAIGSVRECRHSCLRASVCVCARMEALTAMLACAAERMDAAPQRLFEWPLGGG